MRKKSYMLFLLCLLILMNVACILTQPFPKGLSCGAGLAEYCAEKYGGE